jgi:NAD(P)-dependent dehydrogenase (short-subunit alcohol dehydrogenase family)
VTASKAALPYLSTRPGSRIVNIGAVAGGKAAAGMGPYAAAKSGVLRFTEALSQELRNSDCTVNAVLPGIIDTPQNRKDMPDADVSRWVTPDAVANVVLFLLSSQAGAVTGAAIPVTGRM